MLPQKGYVLFYKAEIKDNEDPTNAYLDFVLAEVEIVPDKNSPDIVILKGKETNKVVPANQVSLFVGETEEEAIQKFLTIHKQQLEQIRKQFYSAEKALLALIKGAEELTKGDIQDADGKTIIVE